MYSNLRFVISASVVGCAGLIGVLALLPATLEERLLASTELAAPAARPCKQQIWLNLDRNCLTRRGMPWVAALPARDAAEVPSSAETAAEQPVTEARSSPTAAEDTAQPSEVTASRQETSTPLVAEEPRTATQASEAVPQPQQEEATVPRQAAIAPQQEPVAPQQEAAAPQQEAPAPQQQASAPAVSEEPQRTTKRHSVTPVRHAAPPIAEKRHVAKPAVETQSLAGATNKAAREERSPKVGKEAANKPSNEALNAVRRFQDNLRDIPVRSYAADGTRRTIVIRPTSIQDVYYYSAPR